MRIFFLFLIALGIHRSVSAQVVFDQVKHDFGTLESYDDRFVDITLTNKGTKKEYILTVKKPYDVVYIIRGKFIDKDSSQVIRLQVNPKQKGKFSYEVEVYTSDRNEPTTIKLTGYLKELPQDQLAAFTACPDFSARPGGKLAQFNLTVVTIDKNTREELAQSQVTLIRDGQSQWSQKTDKTGKINEKSELGFCYFYASHDGYYNAELGAYVNFQRNLVVIELEKKPEPVIIPVPPVEQPEIAIEPEEEPAGISEPELVLEQELKQDTVTQIEREIPKNYTDIAANDFSEQYFKPVNVVFVLDVSSSMNQGDKIELLKYSLNQLVDMLRPQDNMGIVTYASRVNVLLEPTSGADKAKIKEEVAGLKASGMTAGGDGIKTGYEEVLSNYLENGVNQVIIITDGAFNQNSSDYKKTIRKYRKKGVRLSVVGIKNKPSDEAEMKQVAELGGGNYIPVFKLADAQSNLKEEIRMNAYISH